MVTGRIFFSAAGAGVSFATGGAGDVAVEVVSDRAGVFGASVFSPGSGALVAGAEIVVVEAPSLRRLTSWPGRRSDGFTFGLAATRASVLMPCFLEMLASVSPALISC